VAKGYLDEKIQVGIKVPALQKCFSKKEIDITTRPAPF
jgi:hypothetical protein